jgi:DNA-binding transcriptional LysR family regulator
LRPALDSFEAAVEAINVFRDKPTGHLRLTMPRPAAKQVIEPIVTKFLATHPGVTLEVVTDSALTDIVRDRFDAGIRPGHRLEQDMIAVRIGDDARPMIVASPEYLARHPRPQVPADLHDHNCLRQRFASGVVSRWSFEMRGKSVEVAVTGSLISSESDLAIRAALDGLGVARVSASYVESHVASKRLFPLLEDLDTAIGRFLSLLSEPKTDARGTAGIH